jgi:hypothetical protein
MIIRTTREIEKYYEYNKYLTENWILAKDIIEDLKDRIKSIEACLGNAEDMGYLKSLECLLDYYKEQLKTTDNEDDE